MTAAARRANKRLYVRLFIAPVLMFGFAFSMVPLYETFCEWTGINGRAKGLTERTVEPGEYAGNGMVAHGATYDANTLGAGTARDVRVTFTTRVGTGVPLRFYAEADNVDVQAGQVQTVVFIAENRSDRPFLGRAVPSVSPSEAAPHLRKLECFCFQEQQFKPYEKVKMPVQLVVDPALNGKVDTVTLAYTFFELKDRKG